MYNENITKNMKILDELVKNEKTSKKGDYYL